MHVHGISFASGRGTKLGSETEGRGGARAGGVVGAARGKLLCDVHVGEADVPRLVDQDILRLNVTVEHVAPVQVLDGEQHLLQRAKAAKFAELPPS